MPKGGKITIEARTTQQAVILEITDTGVGIPLDVDAFEPFVTTKKEERASGWSSFDRSLRPTAARFRIAANRGRGLRFTSNCREISSIRELSPCL